jgi:hypothetical protein
VRVVVPAVLALALAVQAASAQVLRWVQVVVLR